MWGDLEADEEASAFAALDQNDKIALLQELSPGAQERLLTRLSGEGLRVLL